MQNRPYLALKRPVSVSCHVTSFPVCSCTTLAMSLHVRYAPGYEAILYNVGTLLGMSISYTVFVNKKGINSAFITERRFVFTLFTVVRKYT